MISSINSGMPMPPPARAEQNLSDEQQALITETLSQFDPENLSEADATSIIAAFAQAGIQPGAALEEAMSELGFDAKNVGELGAVEEKGNMPPPPPPPPKQTPEEITSMVDYLTELMEEKYAASDSTELSEEDKQSILQQVFEKYNIEDGESIIDMTA